jgi:anti-sigma B factor antagonist
VLLRNLLSNDEVVPHFNDVRDDRLKIRLQRIDDVEGCLVFYLTGILDRQNYRAFQERIGKAIDTGYHRLIFHCSGIAFEHDYDILCYTAFLKRIKPLGGDIVLLEVQPSVYEVYQLLGFSQFFNIHDNLDEAVWFFYDQNRKGSRSAFPVILKCLACGKKLKAQKDGRFRCADCNAIMTIDDKGQVRLE